VWQAGRVDDAAWTALAVTLTALGGLWTWWAWRRRGWVPAMRALGVTLLVPAAYLTRTLRMLTRIVDAVGDWALSLVFSPTVWIGTVLAGVGVALVVVAQLLSRRGVGRREALGSGGSAAGPRQVPTSRGEPAIDDDLADIEALLRERGIS
jgi:hypothetical protein